MASTKQSSQLNSAIHRRTKLKKNNNQNRAEKQTLTKFLNLSSNHMTTNSNCNMFRKRSGIKIVFFCEAEYWLKIAEIMVKKPLEIRNKC